jgi:peptidyl-prolyl isomerase E (cyclophilin E)
LGVGLFLTEVGDHLLLWAQLAKSLFVGGLAEEVTLEILRAAFIPFGELKDVQLPLDAAGKPRGFGFVEFEEEGDAAAAIDNMEGAELFGRTIRVNVARGGGGGGAGRAVWAEAQDWFKKLGEEVEGEGEGAEEGRGAQEGGGAQ